MSYGGSISTSDMNLGNATFTVTANSQQFAQSIEDASQKVQKFTKNVQKSMDDAGTASKNLGRSLLQLGYIADDIQYGFRSILNNIPQLVMGLGGGAGLAGAIGVAAVAINQLSNHWDQFFGEAELGPQKLVESIDLVKKKAEETKAALAEILTGKSFETKESEKFLHEYFTSEIGPNLIGDVAKKIGATGFGAQMTPEEEYATSEKAVQDRVQAARKLFESGGTEFSTVEKAEKEAREKQFKAQQAAQARIDKVNVEMAGELIKKAETDPTARKRLQGLVPPEIAEGIAGLTPEALKAQDFELQDAIDKGKDLHDLGKKRRQAEKEHNKLYEKFFKDQIKDEERAKQKEKWAKQDALRAEIHTLEDKKDEIREANKSRSKVFKSGADYVSHAQQEILDKIPNEQLKELKNIDKDIRVLHDKISKIGRLG